MSRRARGVLGGLALLLACVLVWPAQAADTVVYYHTDALRSVAVVTNAQGQVIERTHYAPYGAVLDRPLRDGPGYGGHEEDAATGLVYMQQRYYCPECGRFLSVDPVAMNPNTGANFNRYWYANDNPYRYTDPDGRETGSAFHSEFVMMGAQAQTYQAPGDWLGPALQAAFASLPVIGPAFGVLNAAANPTKGNVALAVAGVLPAGRVVREAVAIKGIGEGAADAAQMAEKTAADTRGSRFATGKLRQQVMDKGRQADGTVQCAYCGKPTATQSDHIVPYSKGGPTKIENLAPACPSCNASKGAKELGKEWVPPKVRHDQ